MRSHQHFLLLSVYVFLSELIKISLNSASLKLHIKSLILYLNLFFFHRYRTSDVVKFIVKSAGIAHRLALSITSPQWSVDCVAIGALESRASCSRLKKKSESNKIRKIFFTNLTTFKNSNFSISEKSLKFSHGLFWQWIWWGFQMRSLKFKKLLWGMKNLNLPCVAIVSLHEVLRLLDREGAVFYNWDHSTQPLQRFSILSFSLKIISHIC